MQSSAFAELLCRVQRELALLLCSLESEVGETARALSSGSFSREQSLCVSESVLRKLVLGS